MKVFAVIVSTLVSGLLLAACAGSAEKGSKDVWNWACGGRACVSNDDCACDADFCMPQEISAMPGTGPANALKCTRLGCSPEDAASCPEGFECWPLAMMTEYFPEGTQTVCMFVGSPEGKDAAAETDAGDNDAAATDVGEVLAADGSVEETAQKVFPSCYGDSCKTGEPKCCDGTACLPKIAAYGSEEIVETEYCVVKDCVVDDASTCPENYKCLKSGMGSYCIKVIQK